MDVKQGIRIVFVGGGLALALVAAAIAGPFEDGQTAYQNGDYAAAMSYWRPLADHGDALAQISLGMMYESGKGVPQDYAQATAWYRKAADQGDIGAQLRLGLAYFNGQGVP